MVAEWQLRIVCNGIAVVLSVDEARALYAFILNNLPPNQAPTKPVVPAGKAGRK